MLITEFVKGIDLAELTNQQLFDLEYGFLVEQDIGYFRNLRRQLGNMFYRHLRPLPSDVLLTEDQEQEVFFAEQHLHTAMRFGGVLPRHVRGTVVDFGGKYGGASAYLTFQGASVSYVDIKSFAGSESLDVRVRPNDIRQGSCGLQYLRANPHLFDLVAAFYLGYVNTAESFVQSFLDAANEGVKSDGKILVTSDVFTMATVRRLANTPYDRKLGHRLSVIDPDL